MVKSSSSRGPGFIPSPHMGRLTTAWNSSSRGSDMTPFSNLCTCLHSRAHTHLYSRNHIYVIPILKSSFVFINNIRKWKDPTPKPGFCILLIRRNFFAAASLLWPESMSPCAHPALSSVCLALWESVTTGTQGTSIVVTEMQPHGANCLKLSTRIRPPLFLLVSPFPIIYCFPQSTPPYHSSLYATLTSQRVIRIGPV